MSFSFSTRAATKAELKQKVAAELDAVVASQPVHAADRATGEAAANSFIDLLDEPGEGHEIRLSLNGSISTIDGNIQSVNFGFYASNMVAQD